MYIVASSLSYSPVEIYMLISVSLTAVSKAIVLYVV